jgi:Protein of unknown function (DUF2817)
MSTIEHFAESYRDARQRFCTAAHAAGAELSSYRNDVAVGPHAEDLCTDVAWLGPSAAPKVVFAVSGTHGVEGYCGSACQSVLLSSGLIDAAPPDTAFLLVHALNPYGFAYDRRVNEDNVDLNRNFIDHDDPPVNDGYAEIHPALVPADWDGPARAAADAALLQIATTRGVRYLQSVVTAGQWTHPDGLFYGGCRPVWSHRVLRDVATTFLPGRDRVAYIDLHTGLGERGAGEVIFRGGRDDGSLARARRWYGPEVTVSENGTSSSTPIVGNSAGLVAEVLSDGQELTAITLEFGTLPGIEVLGALRSDNWLSLQDCVPADVRASIKQQVRGAFYLADADWREAVLARAQTVFAQAVAGLAE